MLLTDWRWPSISLSIMPPLVFVLVYWQRFARHSFHAHPACRRSGEWEYNQNITGVRVVQSLNRQQENLRHFNE